MSVMDIRPYSRENEEFLCHYLRIQELSQKYKTPMKSRDHTDKGEGVIVRIIARRIADKLGL